MTVWDYFVGVTLPALGVLLWVLIVFGGWCAMLLYAITTERRWVRWVLIPALVVYFVMMISYFAWWACVADGVCK